jgi:hypothetical protein
MWAKNCFDPRKGKPNFGRVVYASIRPNFPIFKKIDFLRRSHYNVNHPSICFPAFLEVGKKDV